MSKQYSLNGRTFSIGILPATVALRVEVAIARVIGEPLFKALVEKKTAEDVGGVVIGLLCSRMNADELEQTMDHVFKYVSCDGVPVIIDSTFTGRPREIWQVFIEALKFNFADFLPAVSSILEPDGKAQKSK